MLSSRTWARKLIAPLTIAWMLITLGWMVLHSEQIGGCPLTIVWSYDPGNYDPQATSHPIAESIFQYVCEPLFYEDFDGTVHGLLAEDEVKYEDDGRRITIQLRQGITFHNGARLTAEAVKTSFERLIDLGTSPLLNDLRGVEVVAEPDRHSVVFTLPEPDYEFVRLVLSNPYAAIVSPQENGSVEPGFVSCTGPYYFSPDQYWPEASLTLMRYSEYHWPPAYVVNRGPARIPEIRFVFDSDRNSRLDYLVNGDGCVLSLSRGQEESVARLSHIQQYDATGGMTYLGFNFLRPRWQNPQVRQAIAMALDKSDLTQLGPYHVADTPLAPNATGYHPDMAKFGYSYNPDLSKTMLAQAGFDFNTEVVILIPESSTYRELVLIVQKQLEFIGIPVRVREALGSDILTERQDFDLLLFDYAWGDYTALGIFLGPGPRNLLNYPSSDIADLVAKARATADFDERQQLIMDAQRIVLEQALWQPLLVRQITFAIDERCVQGVRQSPAGGLVFHDADTVP
jgi:ABC-type transport system substrate-binding protein